MLTGIVGAGVILVLVVLRLLARPRETRIDLQHRDGNRGLVVLVHGLLGRRLFSSAIDVAREALPAADLLIVDYDSGVLSNGSPYAIANAIERAIHQAHTAHGYDEIVLVGHSMGGALLRKAVVWGHGIEEDRGNFGLRGPREWVTRTKRLVSLAAINRGWSIDPRPEHMDLGTYVSIWIGERISRFTQTGRLGLSMRKGSPFVADARVQWITLCRNREADTRVVPQTIHLLGDRDDIVSKEDGMDLIAAKDTIFVTLADTGHREIGMALSGGRTTADQERREKVRWAIEGRLDKLEPDKIKELEEDTTVTRVVYIMHGIRDYGEWTDKLRTVIEGEAAAVATAVPIGGVATVKEKIAVVNQKYGHFPLLPFLLHWDRQKNVRLFMDEYTENRARFPHATTFDYVGHSNGTYILASALQNYKTLQVGRVFFAGSVVPKHYEWLPLAEGDRVSHVANVVAAGDWVVALFPRFFEQIADWLGLRPKRGLLDIGSAGFRGFQDARDAKKRIENVQFAHGSHGTGIDADNAEKLAAISRYIVANDMTGFGVFRNQDRPDTRLAFCSNVCWLLWLGMAAVLVFGGLLTFQTSLWAGLAFVVIVIGLLNSV
jgi:pimeloyl-ACP methyl ester carboxylesterase